MNSLAWLALVLVVLWIILRVSLAVTSGILHLLWIAGVLMFGYWIYRRFMARGGTGGT